MKRTARQATGRSTPVHPSEHSGFEDIILEHMPKLWSVAMQFCRYHRANAEDLMQDAMIRAFRYKDSLTNAENRFAWLRRTLFNTHLNRIRDNKGWDTREDLDVVEQIPSFDPMPVSRSVTEASQKDLWDDDILRALNALPDAHRTVLLMADVQEMPLKEIAELTGMAMGTVSGNLFRARRKLAALLEGYAVRNGFVTRQTLESEREAAVEEMRKAGEMGMM